MGIVALVALIVAGGIFAATKFVGGNSGAVATPTLVPGSNLFYIQTTPGWGNIFVDGQKLAHMPDPTVDPPLQLSPGVHEVTWQANPFMQRCTIIVPPAVSETKCLAYDPVTVPKGPNKGLSAYLITFTASFSDLTAAQQQPLIQAAQQALDALQSSDTVQIGEQYADLNAPQFTATATSTLRATLRFQLDTDPGSNNPCGGVFSGFGAGSSCSISGQNCHLLCEADETQQFVKATPDRWHVYGVMRTTWTYTTLNGLVVAQNQPDETDNVGTEYLVDLYITYADSQWHITTRTPDNTTGFLPAGPSCEAANNFVNFVGQNGFGIYSTVNLPGDPNQTIFWSANHGSNLAAGCLLTAYPPQNNLATPLTNARAIAHCLYRFGVLLALDNATRSFWPNLPLADAYEQNVARHIAG